MTVAVFDADWPPGIHFVRSLGRAGIPLRVYSPRRWPVARFSKHCASFARCPEPADAERFVPWLERELREGDIDLIAPTSDLIAFHCAELGASFPERASVLDCLFKDRFDAACARLGFRTPWAAYPRSVEEARALAETYRYPALLKPKSHVGVGLERGELVRDAAELRRAYRAYQIPRWLRHPELALPMIQEYVPAALGNLYSVSGVLGARGEIIAASASRKAAQWPPTLGIGIEFHSCGEPALLARGIALAQRVLGRGIFEVEFIRDGDDLVAIDLNPRAHGFISFDIARGHDLPLLWYRLATGETVPAAGPARGDLLWTHAVPWQARRWVRRLQGVEVSSAPDSVDIVSDASDPLSSAAFLLSMLRHPGGLLRPFFREREAGVGPAAARRDLEAAA